MELLNLLDKAIPVFGQTFDVSLGFLGQLVLWLISGVGIVGLGVILFSLILKVIVLPFDVFQRISMRKQNQQMKDQKDRMENLQKQYANNQELYNQKLMEMYKENGISMFSSCLPMLLTMVIFFVAIRAFNAYSQFAAVQNYNELVNAYTAKVETYCPDLDASELERGSETVLMKGTAADDYIYYRVNKTADMDSMDDATLKAYIKAAKNKEYVVDFAKASALEGVTTEDEACNYFISQAQTAVVQAYEGTVSENTKFLWIKNIWATDAAHVHPVLTYSEFQAKASAEKFDVNGEKVSYGDIANKIAGTNAYTVEAYDLITGKLETQKAEPNGYYILIALSIGTILLQQFITMRAQKEQNQFSTVDGQGASTQKMTMIMMTGMFAFFAFMYSSAFSLYMIVSNVFSLISTLVINKLVDRKLEQKSMQEAMEKYDNRGLSRIEAAKNQGKQSAQESREKKVSKEERAEEKTENKTEKK